MKVNAWNRMSPYCEVDPQQDELKRDALLAQRVYDRAAELEGLIYAIRERSDDDDAECWKEVKPLMVELEILSELIWPSDRG